MKIHLSLECSMHRHAEQEIRMKRRKVVTRVSRTVSAHQTKCSTHKLKKI